MADIAHFIKEMPKAELHVHIEGAIAPELLFEIAQRNGVPLPYKNADDILEGQNQGKDNPKQNLDSFIECLDISRGALRTGLDYRDIAYGHLKRCQSENIIYTEIMFDPQQGVRQGVALEAIIEGLLEGSAVGRADFGVEVQWIMCFQRDHPAEEALHILKNARPYKDQIIGVGLDNPELPGFVHIFEPIMVAAREKGYRLCSHCDVNIPNSVEHIRGCLNLLGVERIDHGLNALEDEALVAQLLERNIPLTACPTRYAFQAEVAPSRLEMMAELLERGICISLNSDDPAQFGSGWLAQTLIEAQRAGSLPQESMIKFMRNAFLTAWISEGHRKTLLQSSDDYCSQNRA